MILITGASGFVGRNLVKHIEPRSSLRCLVRKISNTAGLEGCQLAYGDITDYDSLVTATKGVDAVVHLVAALSASNYEQNYEVHVAGAEKLIEACKTNGVKRVVVASTVATLADRKSNYGTTKRMADELFLRSGLDVTILRPDFIYGRDGDGFNKLVNIIKNSRFVPIPGDGRYRRQPVHVDDVCRTFYSALTNPAAIGKTYIVASEKPIAFDSMVDMIMEKLALRKRKIHIPISLLLSLAKIMKLAKNPRLTQTVVLGIAQDRAEDVTPMISELGVRPVSFKEGLEKSL